ncbi:unnamed protein product [marine sediment metagenome]|uniref:Uncharacterized protein n=1 Tax=marine sediment metagenome TaxID=412755 RepID=X0SVB2_9ZZZZ
MPEKYEKLLLIIFTETIRGRLIWYGAHSLGTAIVDYMQSPQRPQMRNDGR